MSRIDKLSISGIRSFGPLYRENLEFNTPLTLIVGYNGSGKTTIIECLKFATTGELPPNAKVGGAFIHDPKLVGEKEVKSQVKLSFTSTTGVEYVVTRSLQLLVQKTKRTMKTLEGSILCKNQGERTTESHRAVEMDKMVPDYLGVSSAILDSVIFCHQDESLWPMSEPSALKKRFDEIFEAQQYTKAIDKLKVLRKTKGEHRKKIEDDEKVHRANKERANRVKANMEQLLEEIENIRAEIHGLGEQLKEKDELGKDKRQQANSFLSIMHELQNAKEKRRFRQEAVDEMQVHLEEMSETEEYLEEVLAQYEARIARVKDELSERKEQYETSQQELAGSRRSLAAKTADQGKLESEKESHGRQLATRLRLIREAADQYEIRGYDGELGDDEVASFQAGIQRLLDKKKRELELLQNQTQRELKKANEDITQLEARKGSSSSTRNHARRRITENDLRIQSLQNDLIVLQVDEGSQAVLDSDMQGVEARLDSAKRAVRESVVDQQIQAESERLWQLEAESERLNREMLDCTKLATERAGLNLRKTELTQRKRNLDTAVNTWKAKLDEKLGTAWKPETIESEYHKVMEHHDAVVADARKQKDTTDQSIKELNFKLAAAKDRLRKATAEKSKSEATVVKAVEKVRNDASVIDQYEDVLTKTEEGLQIIEQDIKLFDHLKQFYSKIHNVANQYNKCHFCERDFRGQPEAKSKLLSKIEKYLRPTDKEELEEEQRTFNSNIQALRAVRPQYDTCARLNAELPAIEDEVKALQSQLQVLAQKQDEHDDRYRSVEEQRQDVMSMGKTVQNMGQSARDVEESEKLIERLESQHSSAVAGRGAEEIQELLATCIDQTRTVKNKMQELSSEKQAMEKKVSSLELEKSQLENKISQAARQLERKRDLQNQLAQKKDDNAREREIVQQADKDYEALEPEIAKSRAIRDDARERGLAKENKIAQERDAVAGTIKELQRAEDEIEGYIARDGPAKLAANQRAIKALEKTIANTEQEISEITVQINGGRREIENSDRQKRNIEDNIKYRRYTRELKELEKQIETLESRNAEEDYTRLITQANNLEVEHSRLHSDRAALLGEIKAKDSAYKTMAAEWDLDLAGAEAQYRESHIMLETTKAAIEDIGLYAAALEKAVLQYHGLKMEEINRIMAELWQATYQGTDIDKILIRADHETTSGRRQYNYRVCMVKQDTEMDMRGRCSAGQKVLASIIIRLALAETFSTNCGLIALDEPTTNLDSDNIRSLAQALHSIIQQRQAQANFQLIVITHDEEFLRYMQCSEFCDTFYRVRRNERQQSVIVKQPIALVTE